MFLQYITFFSTLNFLILAGILLIKKSPIKRANNYLGITFLMMALYSLSTFYLHNATLDQNILFLKYFIPLDYTIAMLMGPGIYLYLQIILNKEVSIRRGKICLHAIPALPALLFAAYFMSLPSEIRIDKLIHNFESLMWEGSILNGLFYIQMTTYLFVCYSIISKQLNISKVIVNESVVLGISWLKTFFLLDIVMMLSTAPASLLIANDYINTIIALTVMNVQFIYIFIKSAWLPGLYPLELTTVPVESDNKPQQAQEPALKIDDKLADCYFERLLTYVETQKAYLDKECSLQSLANGAEIPQHHLSNILNNRLNKNFFDFINEYRVEEAKKMLSDRGNKQLTIEAIGFECGFGSKTSFNKAFKKYTNQTPSEYRLS